MSEQFKFPNGGYEVTVLRKQDILDCINDNIIDKEIALAIVEQCEIDAATCLSQGRWTGLPYIANVQVPAHIQEFHKKENEELNDIAKDELEGKKYVMFRKELAAESAKHAKQERLYRYLVSIAVTSNRKLYKRLCDEKGEFYARIFLYACKNITAVDNEFIMLEDNE
nr:MAG TPA: DNA binding protein [Crassvirales sp.]